MKWKHKLPALKAAMEILRFVVVCFQTNRSKKVDKDNSLFDDINIQNIRLILNSDYWPNEQINLDFPDMQAYKNYANFYSIYAGEKRPLILVFNTHYLFVIDCSRRAYSMKSFTVDIKLDVKATKDFLANTKAKYL